MNVTLDTSRDVVRLTFEGDLWCVQGAKQRVPVVRRRGGDNPGMSFFIPGRAAGDGAVFPSPDDMLRYVTVRYVTRRGKATAVGGDYTRLFAFKSFRTDIIENKQDGRTDEQKRLAVLYLVLTITHLDKADADNTRLNFCGSVW